MRKSESIVNLSKALLIAQKKMGGAVKGSRNPFFKSSYADLPTVMEVVKEPLNDAGIIILQPAHHADGRNFIMTSLIHAETGEFMESLTEVICAKANDPQAFGAAQTYARRFGLQSMIFIPSEDDDGNQASGRSAPKSLAGNSSVSLAGAAGPAVNEALVSTQPIANGSVQLEPFKKSNFRNKAPVKEVPPSESEFQ